MKLVVLDGPMKGEQFPITKSPTIIGRARGADVCLPLDPLMSRFHAQVVKQGDAMLIEDMGSGNGTYLAGRRLEQATPFPTRSFARVGHTHVCLLDDADSADEFIQRLGRGDSDKLTTTASEAKSSEVTSFKTDRNTAALVPEHAGGVQVIAEDRPDRQVSFVGTIDPRDLAGLLPTTDDVASANRLRTRLRVFLEVSEALAGKMDATALLEAVVDSILRVIPAERAFVLISDQSDRKLRAAVSRQRGHAQDSQVTLSRTLIRKALREKVAVLVHDTMSDEALREARSIVMSSIRAAMCVPVMDGERVAALIHLDTRSAHAFTQEDLELVTAIANQAAVALANVRMYEELKKAYEELESAHDQMVQSEKLSMIGTLAASIAHDLGNILTPISGIAKIVLKQPDLDPKLKVAFERNMDRLKAMAQQLLSFSRPKPPDLVPIDVGAAVKESLELVTTEARHANVKVVMELAPDLPKVRADQNRLDQVFINLTINALHAMADKGGDPVLTIRTRRDGPHVVVEFADNGPGIPADRLKLIFEPFFTTKGKKGTGMGLFSCKRIVEEEHGGRLEVESVPGQGATFLVKLPA